MLWFRRVNNIFSPHDYAFDNVTLSQLCRLMKGVLMHSVTHIKTLNQLEAGTIAEIVRMADCGEAIRRRLHSLGFFEGQSVRVLRSGNPMVVEVMRVRVGMARSLAEGIGVCQKAAVTAGPGI